MHPWYPHYPGDYVRDTAHLSLVQHGAYRLLLDHYYATRGPLPADKAALYRICRAFDEWEREAVDFVISQFFQLRSDGYHNGRADFELLKQEEHHKRLSSSGRRGAEKRWKQDGETIGPAYGHPAGQANSPTMANPQPQPHPQPQEEKNNTMAPSAPSEPLDTSPSIEQSTRDAAFEIFWEAWPRKQNKAAGRKAWMKVPIAEYPTIMTGLQRWKTSHQWNRGVIPHAATWLSEKRWQDEDVPQCGGSNGRFKLDPNQRTRENLQAAGLLN